MIVSLNERILKVRRFIHPPGTKVDETNFFTPSRGIREMTTLDLFKGIVIPMSSLCIDLKRKERPIDELSKAMEPFPQVLYNIEVKEKKNLFEIPEVAKRVKKIRKTLGTW